jgi:predicted GIY-YIG superfamily endonuclease
VADEGRGYREESFVLKFYVYRFFDSQDNLLYVGCTDNWRRRFREHKKSTWWAFKIKRDTIEEFPDEETARRAELTAIGNETPIYNKRGRTTEWDSEFEYNPCPGTAKPKYWDYEIIPKYIREGKPSPRARNYRVY